MKTTQELLDEIIHEKRLQKKTIDTYKKSIEYFETHTEMTIPELIQEQDKQRKKGVLWKDTILKEKLVSYRNFLHHEYKHSTATQYFAKIKSLLHFYDVEIGRIQPIKTPVEHFNFSGDLPTREEIRDCMNSVNAPIIKAFTLCLSSTGMSPVDALKLNIRDYMQSTKDYHNYNKHHNIETAILEMKNKDVIPTFIGFREKSGQQYLTFASPEFVKATNIYLLSRDEKLTQDSQLFKMSYDHLKNIFREINNQLKLGLTVKGQSRFCMKNMRAYHTNQLRKAGWSIGDINILEGRKNKDVVYQHYVRIDEKELKEKYIDALPFIVIEDIHKVKTELDVAKEKNVELESENTELKKQNEETNARLDNLEKIVLGSISDDEKRELHNLL